MEPLFWTAIVGITIVFFIVVCYYNVIVSNGNSVIRSWSDVITYERQKNNILPKIEEALKNYQEYERDLQIKITDLRSSINSINTDELNNKNLLDVESKTLSLMKAIKIALENYPDLKASVLMQNFMKEIARQQENIAAAIAIFNKNVEAFNNGIQTFPGHIVNNFLNNRAAIEPFSDTKALDAFEYKFNL